MKSRWWSLILWILQRLAFLQKQWVAVSRKTQAIADMRDIHSTAYGLVFKIFNRLQQVVQNCPEKHLPGPLYIVYRLPKIEDVFARMQRCGDYTKEEGLQKIVGHENCRVQTYCDEDLPYTREELPFASKLTISNNCNTYRGLWRSVCKNFADAVNLARVRPDSNEATKVRVVTSLLEAVVFFSGKNLWKLLLINILLLRPQPLLLAS